jgi:uncharacterized phage protein gp47/JayE
MARIVPTAAELKAQFISNYEAALNQTVPLVARAFVRVISNIQAIMVSGLYKYATDRTLQALVLTASGTGLDLHGQERGIARKAAEATVLTATLTGVNGTVIPSQTEYSSESTGAVYTTNADVTVAAGVATIELTAELPGVNGDLPNGETLLIGAQISGLASFSTVASTENEGLDRELDDDYRRRILADLRNPGGGGNLADYREWSESVADVNRAYPYSGKPETWTVEATDISFAAADSSINSVTTDFTALSDLEIEVGHTLKIEGSASNDGVYWIQSVLANKLTVYSAITNESAGATISISNESLPGDRTVYIESRVGTGVPTQTLLDEVRDAINIDPDTGLARPAVGDTDEFLYVEPIYNTTFDVEIRGLQIDVALETATKAKILTALTNYLEYVEPFITGLDYERERYDAITDLSISRVVQDVVASQGGSADGIGFKVAGTSTYLGSYFLGQGELADIGTVTYA